MLTRRLVLGMRSCYAVVLAALVGVCSACGKTGSGTAPNATPAEASAASVARVSAPADAGFAILRDVAMWAHAKEGDEEDLATLATHEGAAGLIEAAAEPALRTTALRAMGFAPGYAQTPFLARVAAGKDDADAKLALDALVEIAERVRRQDADEDADELGDACNQIVALAKDTGRPKERRIPAIRALRMLPCPKAGIPTDLDAR
ncbi:MAG: hypothetical protein FWD69_07880 [Polyangiaceae bacterium]|nr:hypothetical protein [Polyangiaceae bacterium]